MFRHTQKNLSYSKSPKQWTNPHKHTLDQCHIRDPTLICYASNGHFTFSDDLFQKHTKINSVTGDFPVWLLGFVQYPGHWGSPPGATLSRVNEWHENGWGGEGTLGGEWPSINGKVLEEASKLMAGKIEMVSWCFIECSEPSVTGIIISLPATIQLYFASFSDNSTNSTNDLNLCTLIHHRVHKWMRQNAGTMVFSQKQPVLTRCLWSLRIEDIWRIRRWC
jgi:hypothetical protein